MKLYLAICEDRHIDVVVKVFDNKEMAIEYVKQFVKDNTRHPEDIVENDIPGYIYQCSYSCEGDHVIVKETTLNGE